MKAQIKILSGGRAGLTAVFSQNEVTVGRHPTSDLQLDPDRDLAASARHAVLLRQGDRWLVRDIGSSNGTLVNGHRISADTKLDDTDQIQVGADGPTLEFRLVSDGTPDQSLRAPAPATPAARPTAGTRAGGSTTQRIRVEVGRQTRKLRVLSVGLVGALVVAAGLFAWSTRREQADRARAAAAATARIDSVVHASEHALQALQGRYEDLANALRSSQGQVQRLQTQLNQAVQNGNRAQVAVLRKQLDDATAQLHTQQVAAQVDYQRIADANEGAVALIWVDFGPGGIFTGTAFSVSADGKMITNRHVVAGKDGSQHPIRIAIQFANSTQVWRGKVLAVDDSIDLALVQVLGIAGSIPTVKGLAPDGGSTRVGEPVAMIGFPLGLDLPMGTAGTHRVVRTTLTTGIVSKVLPDLVQLDAYGAEGASGSPVFDRDGRVVAVLYGGQPGTNGRIVYTVPVRYVTDLLRRAR